MDPREGHSAINDSACGWAGVLADSGVKVFQIETTLNSETFPSNLGFLNKREWEWSAYDQGLMMAAKKGNDLAPPRVRREFFRRIEAPVQADRDQRRRGRGRPRADADEPAPPAAGRGEGPVRRADHGSALPRPLQRELDPEPDPRALPGAGLPVQHVPEQAARAGGRRRDPAPPGAVGVQPDPPPQLHRLLRRGAARDHRPEGDRGEVRGAVRHRPLVPPPVPDQPRLPRRAPVLHVVLGRARSRPRRRRDLRRRRTPRAWRGWATGARTRCATRSRWRRTPWARRRR